MKLSPLDIKRQQFGKSFRGYEPDEVDAFVKQVASQWESLLDELRLATERNRELGQKLKHYERVELALQEALETARETARRSEESAERKAKIIIEQAELKADRTLQDVEQERFGLRRDIAKLTGRQNEVAARLRAFLMSELEILAQFQGDDPVGFIRLESAGTRSETIPEQLQPHHPSPLPTGDSSTGTTNHEPSPDLAAAPNVAADIALGTADTETVADASNPVAEPVDLISIEGIVSEVETSTTPLDARPIEIEDTINSEASTDAEPEEIRPDPIGWNIPETVEPELQSGAGSDWNLRTLVTGKNDSVAGSEAERERIRRILEDLD